MPDEFNNEYLRQTANAVDGGGTPAGSKVLSAVMMTNEGFVLESKCYKHGQEQEDE